jgi:regulator of cell morphogenesis and NO signaling
VRTSKTPGKDDAMDIRGLSATKREALRREWEHRKLADLIEHIESHYHGRARGFIDAVVPKIKAIENETPEGTGDVLVNLKHLREMLTENFLQHLDHEEEMLFPQIRALEAEGASQKGLKSLGRIHDEHDQITDTLIRLKVQTTLDRLQDVPDERAKALCSQLESFLADLTEHVFLEDEILFVGALHLEKHG